MDSPTIHQFDPAPLRGPINDPTSLSGLVRYLAAQLSPVFSEAIHVPRKRAYRKSEIGRVLNVR